MQESKTRLEGLDRRIRLGGEIHSHMGRRLASDRPVNLRSFLPSCLPHCLAPPIEPPEPSSRASAAAHCLRRRSSSSTATNRNLPRIPASICASDMSQLSQISHESPAPNCKSCLFALPWWEHSCPTTRGDGFRDPATLPCATRAARHPQEFGHLRCGTARGFHLPAR
jgi:hypothetical protein